MGLAIAAAAAGRNVALAPSGGADRFGPPRAPPGEPPAWPGPQAGARLGGGRRSVRRRRAGLRLARWPALLVSHGHVQTGGGSGVPQARGEDHAGHGVLAGLQGRRQPSAARGAWGGGPAPVSPWLARGLRSDPCFFYQLLGLSVRSGSSASP